MVELDEATRKALSELYGPSAAARAQVLTNLRAQLGSPGGPDGSNGSAGSGTDPGPPTPVASTAGSATTGQALWVAKIVAATLGLTGAGLLALTLGAKAIQSAEQTSPLPSPALAAAAAPPVTEFEAPPPPPHLEEPTRPSEPPRSTSSDPSPPRTRTRASPERQAPSATHESELNAELALIRGAKQLQARAPDQALVRLEQHAREFPQGQLALEREVLRIELNCALGRPEQARSLARAFSATADPRLRARVEASCAGTGLARGGH